MKHIKKFESFEFIKESIEQLQKISNEFGDGKIDMTKPSIFQYTIYRLPTKDEIEEFENFPLLSPDDILKGFSYTMIGRGIKNQKNIKMIQSGIKMLTEKYPEDERYKESLSKSYELKPKNIKIP